MIVDNLMKLVEEQSLVTAISDQPAVDFHQEWPNSGQVPMFCLIQMKGASGSGSVTFKLQDSANNSAFEDVMTFTVAGKDLGDSIFVPMPLKHRRYIRLSTTVSSTIAGTLSRAVITNEYEAARKAKLVGYDRVKTAD